MPGLTQKHMIRERPMFSPVEMIAAADRKSKTPLDTKSGPVMAGLDFVYSVKSGEDFSEKNDCSETEGALLFCGTACIIRKPSAVGS